MRFFELFTHLYMLMIPLWAASGVTYVWLYAWLQQAVAVMHNYLQRC